MHNKDLVIIIVVPEIYIDTLYVVCGVTIGTERNKRDIRGNIP